MQPFPYFVCQFYKQTDADIIYNFSYCPGFCWLQKTKSTQCWVSIYLLKSFAIVSGKCQVNAATAVLQDAPVVNNSDIVSYSPGTYQYLLSDAAIQKVKTLDDRNAFAITVDKKVIYYGLVKLNISSSSCDHSITMDIMQGRVKKINLILAIPACCRESLLMTSATIPK